MVELRLVLVEVDDWGFGYTVLDVKIVAKVMGGVT